MDAREQHDQAPLVAVKDRAFDRARGNDELLTEKCVLGDQLRPRAGQIGGEAGRDASRTPCVAKRSCRPGAARKASDVTRREPMPRCTARSERTRARSSSLAPGRILSDRG